MTILRLTLLLLTLASVAMAAEGAISPTIPAPPIKATPKATPFAMQAANVAFDASGSRVVATGTAAAPVLVTGADGTLKATKVTYDMQADRLLAEDNVIFTDPSGTQLVVDKMELTGNLKAGTLSQMRLALPGLGSVGSASAGSISGSTFTLKNVAYSPCKTCAGARKPWQIKADQAVFNQASGTMTYKNARLDVYGVPVAYVPWFRHPLGTKNPQSGLLPPSFGRSETFGDQVSLGGYIWSPTENADYTLKTRLMTERGMQLMAERRQVGTNLSSEIKLSGLRDNGLPLGQGANRSHASAVAQYNFSPNRRVGLNAEVASDDTYLNQFFDRTDPYLTSTVFAEDGDEQMFIGANLTQFRDLNPAANPATTAQVLPHLQAARWWQLGPQGAQLQLNGDLLALQRSFGTDTRRMATRAAYIVPTVLNDGSKLTFGATTRADFYTISGAKNGIITRVLPELTAKFEKPYLSASGYHQIASQAMLAVSPRGGNSASKIPNEDSVAYELDTTNLFEASRFAGLDRVETGPRFIYGLDNRWGSADHTDYRFFFGQSIRKFDDTALPLAGGASTNVSDWVSEAEANPADWLRSTARFRLDNSTFVVRRLDADIALGHTGGAQLATTYSFLDNGPESLITRVQAPLAENWAWAGRTRHDIANSNLLEADSTLTWFRDCYALEFIARRKGFRSTNLQPSTDYLINVQLLTLGRSGGLNGLGMPAKTR